jgi:hypothetical protein
VPGQRRRGQRFRQHRPRGHAQPAQPVFEATLQANLVHTFTGTGTIFFRCSNNMPITGSATAQETEIIAIKVAEITSNTAVSG